MNTKASLVYNPEVRNYNFGEIHPFRGERFEIFVDFIKEKVPNFKNYFEEIKPSPADDEDLKLVHSEEYIKAITKASEGFILPNILKYSTPDNFDRQTGYLPKGIEKAARIVVGGSLLAGNLVFKRKFKKAISIGGGLHHAKKEKGEGFCIYNDVAICAKNLFKKGAKRILILDTDAHAGNGTMQAFYEDSRVLFIDLHQDPKTLYPGEGFLNEIGKGRGEGFTVNIPLPPGAGDSAYQYVFDEIIFPLALEFKPEIIIRNGGSDPYFDDKLTQLGLTLDGFKMIGKNVRDLADKVCQGKEVDLIASGYNQEILPLAWLNLIAGLLNLDITMREPKQKIIPKKDSKFKETKEVVKELKKLLKKYWKCLE